eukprot:7394912-Pyramimonas_sp.AAC.1
MAAGAHRRTIELCDWRRTLQRHQPFVAFPKEPARTDTSCTPAIHRQCGCASHPGRRHALPTVCEGEPDPSPSLSLFPPANTRAFDDMHRVPEHFPCVASPLRVSE